MAMAKKTEKRILAQTKAQERLLLFWVGCVCPMGMLYEPTQALYVLNQQNVLLSAWMISWVIFCCCWCLLFGDDKDDDDDDRNQN